jgi:hypothetical protein
MTKGKRKNNGLQITTQKTGLQITTQKTKDRAPRRTPPEIGCEHMCSGRDTSSFSTSRPVLLLLNDRNII